MLGYSGSLDVIAQIGISVLGVLALFLVSKKNKWGFAVGLSSIPFWFMTSIINQLWGVFLLNIIHYWVDIWNPSMVFQKARRIYG